MFTFFRDSTSSQTGLKTKRAKHQVDRSTQLIVSQDESTLIENDPDLRHRQLRAQSWHSLDNRSATPVVFSCHFPHGQVPDRRSMNYDPHHQALSSIPMTPTPNDDIITINISGERFQTYRATLERYPDTLLGDEHRRAKYWNALHQEYFFDRKRQIFESILYIYQSGGRVLRPPRTPIDHFLDELEFFDVGEEVMTTFWESEGYVKPPPHPVPKSRWQRLVWQLLEHADSSSAARCVATFSVFVIILSITNFCLETIKPLHNRLVPDESKKDTISSPFYVIEIFCISWFTFELIARLICSPDKRVFCRNILNIIDFLSIIPFYTNLVISVGGAQWSMLRVIRLVRVFRIFKLSRHSVGLQILAKTFAASAQEFALLIFFLMIALVLFSSGMYFVESDVPDSNGKKKFGSIPETFWYTMVTMTTIGYGDMVPIGVPGKLIGSMCALFGVLTLAMPVPIIVANFKHFYEQEMRLSQIRRAPGRANSSPPHGQENMA